MRSLDSATSDFLLSRAPRDEIDFVYVIAKDNGVEVPFGLWSGDDTIETTVVSGQTGLPVVRQFYAAGALLSVSPVVYVTDLTIKRLTVGLSQINDAVEQLVRGYDIRRAPIEVHKGYRDADTMNLVAPPIPDFVGFVNGSPVRTPSIGQEGGIQIECVSNARTLTFVNPVKRSHSYQQTRSDDQFRQYNDVAGSWQVSWGEQRASGANQ